jgi:adenosine deaminase
VELHAHLSGSVRPATLLELAQLRGPEVAAQAEHLLRDATPDTRDHRYIATLW